MGGTLLQRAMTVPDGLFSVDGSTLCPHVQHSSPLTNGNQVSASACFAAVAVAKTVAVRLQAVTDWQQD